MDIQLNFINQSNDANHSQIVIFQKNLASGWSEVAIAWLVFDNPEQGENVPFVYPTAMQVGASDSWGNPLPKLNAWPGTAFQVTMTDSGDTLSPAGTATYPTEVQVLNNLLHGAINASIYRDGRLLATRNSIAPNQMAAFEFRPTIWIGAVSEAVQGQVMGPAMIEQVNTELSLLGIASADIVMTGGGAGSDSTPFVFTLQNIVRA